MKDLIIKSLDIAQREGLPIKIIYENEQGITERVILVKSIKGNSLVAYCRLRRRISTFKLEMILAAEILYGKQ